MFLVPVLFFGITGQPATFIFLTQVNAIFQKSVFIFTDLVHFFDMFHICCFMKVDYWLLAGGYHTLQSTISQIFSEWMNEWMNEIFIYPEKWKVKIAKMK